MSFYNLSCTTRLTKSQKQTKMKHLIKIVFLTLLMATAAHVLQAQQHIPGYLGKRFFLEVQAAPTGYYRIFGAIGTKPESPITVAPKISLNYVGARNAYFSLEVEQHQFKQIENDVSNLRIFGVQEVDMQTTIRRIGIGLYATAKAKTKTTTIAPIGRYFGYRLYYGQLSSKPTNFAVNNPEMAEVAADFYDANYENPSRGFFGFNIAWGHRIMLNEHISFQFGLDLGYHFMDEPDFYSDENKRHLLSNSDLRDFGAATMSIQTGLGVLLF